MAACRWSCVASFRRRVGQLLLLTPVAALTACITPRPLPVGVDPPPATGVPRSRGPEVRVHDPSTILRLGGRWRLFATGMGVSALASDDLIHWRFEQPVFAAPPGWVREVVPNQRGHFWAPDALRVGDRVRLYYSVSSWGRNSSAIALASAPAAPADGPGGLAWHDDGIVVRSRPGDDFNAIDPSVFADRDGRHWLAFGSFWSGIRLIELDSATGHRIAEDSPIHSLARHEAIEAPALHRRGRDYFLFVNWGACCRGTNSTYEIRVGRSRQITGPYLDRDGRDLRDGGGTLVLGSSGNFIGPGHAGVLRARHRDWLSCHFYDGRQQGRASLAILPLHWTAEGWPMVQPPDATLP